jgi:hypothetical protein
MKAVQVALITAVLATTGSVRLSGGQAFPPPTGTKTGQQIPGMPQAGHNNPADPDSGPLDPHREEQQAALRNTDRQKRLVADTDKLLALATDLKAQVDKSTKDTLSVDVIKKADEIEKLAHSVKERMKG